MTALIALLALSTYAPATSPLEYSPAPALLAPAAAEDGKKSSFSYSYVEANYLWTDLDAIDDSLDGWEVRLSFELPLNFFLQGAYSELAGDADLSQYRLGAGWHMPLGDVFDVYGILSVTGAELEEDAFDTDEDGIAAEVGGRFLLGDRIELNGRGLWVDLEDSEAGLGVGGRFYFTPALSAGLNVDYLDNSESYTAGLRFQF